MIFNWILLCTTRGIYIYICAGVQVFFCRFCADLSCFGMAQTMQAFLCDKAAVIGDTIKEIFIIIITKRLTSTL